MSGVSSPALDLHGANITALSAEQALALWNWVSGADDPSATVVRFNWLYGTFDDGVLWGRFDSGEWRLPTAFEPLVPSLRMETLWELRLFGPDEEIILWKEEGLDDSLRGRSLTSAATTPGLAPLPSQLILTGDRIRPHTENGNGFTLVTDATGARQVVPIDCTDDDFLNDDVVLWPLRVDVLHHLRSEPNTGQLHIAATRLLGLRKDAP